MAARDLYHQEVREALEKEGWKITHAPLNLKYGDDRVFIELGAEQVLGAEKEGIKIAVEIKSLDKPSPIYTFHEILGQYEVYELILAKVEPNRILYLALPEEDLNRFFKRPLGELIISEKNIRFILFDSQEKILTQWIK